ncbi:MAG: carboxypeptidase regulatory-like domain-containing protein [Bacteroidetes bacterium]|nr:carboxypeptidase regulatory-like domain-containing protein [Bacteroidota bacterium]
MKKFSLFMLFLLVVFTLSCNKDENNDSPTVSNTYTITLVGQINDENGQGIPNVTVQVGNKIDQTDGNGIYLIEKASVNTSRAVVKATKTGYWSRSSGFIPRNSTVQYCNLVMPQKAAATSLQSSTGGSVTSAGATVVFPPNAIVTATGLPFNGTVNITSKHLATTDPNFGALIPGGDLMAEDNAGTSVKLISFGMMGVELTDNSGNPLQLASGVTATVQLPIASTQLASAPATIPLWYFDETKSLWIEEGSATKQGNNYVGQVEHFSWWNCDIPTPAATISGYVYDNFGNPIVNAIIYYNNVGGTYTDQYGYYSGLVTSGSSSTIYATHMGINSSILSIPALTAGQLYNVPDIVFSCSSFGKFKGNFVDCNNQPTNIYIQFNGSTGKSLVYSPNGIINSIILCGAQSINCFSPTSFFDTSFTQPCLPDSMDLGTISVCNNSGIIFFKFNLSSSIANGNFLELNPSYIFTQVSNADSTIELTVNSPIGGTAFHCVFSDFFNYSPGTYPVPGIGFEIEYFNGQGFYYLGKDPLNPNLDFTIIQNGAAGDTLELTINGPVNVFDGTSTMVPGTLNTFHLKCIRNW